MKSMSLSLLVAIGMLLGGCVYSPVPAAYNNAKHTTGDGFVDNDVEPIKTGKSTCTQILTLVGYGDCTVEAAKKSGGITKVNSVEHESYQILFFYGEYSTVVKGE